jgi:N-acetylglutamate synthase-like GNAT family acetyltransferase
VTIGFSIRGATDADREGILECLRQAFEPYREHYTPLAFSDTVLSQETLPSRFAEMQVLVAVDDSGRVIGTIAYKHTYDEGHIRGMAVRPELHGSRVAESLLHQVEQDLRALSCRSITLDTTRPLRRAIRFYERNGFRATGEVAEFFGMELLAYKKEL